MSVLYIQLKKWSPSLLLFMGVLIFAGFKLLTTEKLMVDMETKTLRKGKTTLLKAEILYQPQNADMVAHYISPFERVVITNSKGEIKIFDPKRNTITQKQGQEFSSENSFFYHFLSNRTHDMGLKSMNFSLMNTRFEEGLVITTWIPPAAISNSISRIELVHKNFKPIYMGYFSKEGKIIRKVFYYEYYKTENISFPLKVTEFMYLPGGDSTITKTTYSNPRINQNAISEYFNFKIPANAKNID